MGGRFFYFGVQPAGDFCVWGGGERKAFPYEGKVARRKPWRCENPKPPLSGEVARRNAETERSYQICDNLSGEPLGAAEWAHNMLWGILRLPRKMGRKGLKGLENRRKA